jgi:hypothetical protein
MPDEQSGQGQEAAPTPEAPDAGQPAESPRMIEVGGKQFTEQALAESYAEAQRKISEMGTTNADLSGKLKEYQGWADPIKDRYNASDADRQAFDEWWNQNQAAQGQPSPVSYDNQRLLALESKIAKQDQEQAFNHLRAKGMNLSTQDESAILNEIATNPAIQDVEAAYTKLFWEREIQAAKSGAVADTANQMAGNQGAYEKPPTGGAPQGPAAEDVRAMAKNDPDKFAEAAIEEIRKNYDFGNT